MELFSALKSMQGLRVLFFFSTKKNPAPNGEEEGRMMLAARYIAPLLHTRAETSYIVRWREVAPQLIGRWSNYKDGEVARIGLGSY